MVECGDCGKELPPEFGEMPRKPCLECGSTSRDFTLMAEPAHFQIVGCPASLIHTRPGLQSTADADDEGRITLTATGPAPRNEDDALEVCERLVRALNSMGENWSIPAEGEQDIDGFATNANGNLLEMQVVRACNNGGLWQQVNDSGSATIEYVARTAAREMLAAILKKSGKYPQSAEKEDNAGP